LLAPPGITIRKRVAFLFYVVLLAYIGLAGRLAFIQFVRGEELRGQALEVRMRDIPVEAKRGVIYDRLGHELAVSVNVESVFAFPSQVKEPASTARSVSTILGIDYQDTLDRLTKPSSFVWIKRKIEEDQARRLKALKMPGIEFTQESRRFYPKENLAAHILGIAGIDSQGLEGVEFKYDKDLKGVPGRIIVEFDARGRELPQAMHKYIPPVEGNSVFLTIDEVVQFIAERELEKLMVKTQAKAGAIIIIDPKTGDVLALANRPDFDPNRFGDSPDKNRRNLAISDAFPPGSTFKPVTAAAALDEGAVRIHDRFYCGGSLRVSDRTIHCHKASGHGSQTFVEVVQNSCNVGFMQIGARLGKEKFYKYVSNFGLTRETGVDLPGEAKGIMMALDRIKPVDLAVMSFGQTLTVTPIQLASAVACIANDGLMMKPRVVREIRSAEGTLVREMPPEPLRQVISKQSAAEMRGALEKVIEEGTGKGAQVEGYNLAGKTGTAQKVVNGRIAEGKYIASFVGFGPSESPRVVTLVFIDEPAGAYYGGVIAAPVFAAVMGDVLRYLEVPRQTVANSQTPASAVAVAVPDVINMTLDQARKKMESTGLSLKVQTQGKVVAKQVPSPGSLTPKGSMVVVEMGPAEVMGQDGKLVLVPKLAGLTMREAAGVLSTFDLRIAATGSGVATSQQPAAGTYCHAGAVVTVRFSPGGP
jgi:stage V sporulation protein D (sporulation-specific penicillin-binding protein)